MNKVKSVLFMAGVLLALAFTFSCSGSNNNDDGCGDIKYGSLSYQGKTYKTVKICNQTWMAENLNYNASGSRCYADSEANCNKYGRLYNWETAISVCPSGWHLPSNADWDKLVRYVDGTSGTESPYESPTAGWYLKVTSGWNRDSIQNIDGNGEDKYGFSALPGGDYISGFEVLGDNGTWWSSSTENSDTAYLRSMAYYSKYVYSQRTLKKNCLYSIRCVKD